MNPYPKLLNGKIPLWRMLARIGFPTILYWDREHFEVPMPIYVAYCKWHGVYYLDYPHGYDGRLQYPLCWELFKKVISESSGQPERAQPLER